MPFHLDMNDPAQAQTAERLRTTEILWLASVRPDGRPHLVPVWFLWEDGAILIFSKPDSQKVRNLRQNAAVTVSLDDTHQGDDVVVLEGMAELLGDADVTTTLPAYAEKYAQPIADLGWTAETMSREYSQPIRITVTRQANV